MMNQQQGPSFDFQADQKPSGFPNRQDEQKPPAKRQTQQSNDFGQSTSNAPGGSMGNNFKEQQQQQSRGNFGAGGKAHCETTHLTNSSRSTDPLRSEVRFLPSSSSIQLSTHFSNSSSSSSSSSSNKHFKVASTNLPDLALVLEPRVTTRNRRTVNRRPEIKTIEGEVGILTPNLNGPREVGAGTDLGDEGTAATGTAVEGGVRPEGECPENDLRREELLVRDRRHVG